MSGSQTTPATRRPRRKKALRIGGYALLVSVLSYLLTPWLVPDQWIAATVASRMQSLMNRPVQIESVVFDYSRGLTIKGFRIGRRAGFGDGSSGFFRRHISLPLCVGEHMVRFVDAKMLDGVYVMRIPMHEKLARSN